MDALWRAKPIAEIPAEACRALGAIAFDIDDTITTRGRIPSAAFDAVWRAHDAGLAVVPVTGRPAGWADHIARMWPVDGVVAENGALWLRRTEGGMKRRYVISDAERRERRARLGEIAAEVLRRVPGTALAADQAYRELDVAIDFCEDVAPLDDAAIDRIVEIFHAHGASAKVSSIHVNAWIGDWDKLGMLRALLSEIGIDTEARRDAVLYVGDSPNDEPLFRFFPVSAGVANVSDFRARLVHAPAFIATRRGGEGFAEIVDTILGTRSRLLST